MATSSRQRGPQNILSIGYPLLDYIVTVDKKYLDLHKIKQGACGSFQDIHKKIFHEIESLEPEIRPGGSITNTARVIQWLLPTSRRSLFIGAIGKDHQARLLIDLLNKEKIDFIYHQVSDRTGRKLVFITEEIYPLSVILDLGAASKLTAEFIDQRKVWDAYKKSLYIYMSAAMIEQSIRIVEGFAELCCKEEKVFVLRVDLPMAFIKYQKALKRIFNFVRIAFGSEEQLIRLAKGIDLNGLSFRDLLLQVNLYEKKFKPHRITIVTRGERPVMMAVGTVITEHFVPPVKPEDILDETGGGDAFIGGFLGKYIQNRPLEECIKMGIGAAQVMLKHIGCSFDAASEIREISANSS